MTTNRRLIEDCLPIHVISAWAAWESCKTLCPPA